MIKQLHMEQLIAQLQNAFNGSPWYGDAILQRLTAIDYRKVNTSLAASNSIAMLVKHIVNWRIFVLKKLAGDIEFDIVLNDINDWTAISIQSEKEWVDLIAELQTTQDNIIKLLRKKDDAFLKTTVPNRTYTFEHMIEGIIQHDIYHLGQIGLLDRLIRTS